MSCGTGSPGERRPSGLSNAKMVCHHRCHDAHRGDRMTTRLYRGDLPDLTRYGREVAIDTETMGLDPHRDRLCVVQLSAGDGSADVVQIPQDARDAPNLVKLLTDPGVTKIFHYARFDMAVLKHRFGVVAGPVYCTKIASRLVRTYTDRHGLKDLARELLNIEMSKIQQSSDWGADKISEAQLDYAASDVLYLHDIKRHLDRMLRREGRQGLADACFAFLPTRIELDLLGWAEEDLFAHS
jgi:ribonuclease D